MKQACVRALLFSSTSMAVMAAAPSAFAQDADQVEEDTIIVTGSRIARDPNLSEPLPIQSLNSDAIRFSGETDLTEVINDIPALLTTTTAAGSIDGIFAGAVGGSTLNLRGLGEERTLTLVNGRRHVGGVAGSATVDINSIPSALVERVDVLTGGASSIYGADAVTGVVNFILKRDFEGFQADLSGGISDQGDGERYSISAVAGKNFKNDRLNVTVSFDYSKREEILFGDRDFARDNNISDDLPNPARRFQAGDIDAAATPNFAQFFNTANGFFPTGFSIPTAAGDFITSFTDQFGVAPTLTDAELALIERAATAPTRAILPQPTFSISSNTGVILAGNLNDFNFFNPGTDIDGNGQDDCLESFVGFNSLFDFANSFGLAGGCYTVDRETGQVRPYQDGLISGTFNQFGGDGIPNNFDADFLTPELENVVGNIFVTYDLTNSSTFYLEGKVSDSTADSGGPLNTFYDLLTVATDNPFIPAALAPTIAASGGALVTRDPTDLGPNINTEKRRVYRVVTGVEAEGANGFQYDLSLNWGRFERESIDRNAVIQDRFFAAVDATSDAAGNPVCRSDLDPTTVSPTTPFNIPAFDFGYFTFNPGDGSCVPYNVFAGPNEQSQALIDFVTTTAVDVFTLEQFVVNGTVVGDLDKFTTLPGGSIGFAAGFEYRAESSESEFDPLVRGVVPINTPDATAGTLVSDLPNVQNALVFDPASFTQNEGGEFSVWEFFSEVQLPILKDRPFFNELQITGSARFADYSTIGSTISWGVAGTWAPIEDIKFRASYAEPIRAPNITELFRPSQGATFRPIDPCDQAEIDALNASGDPRGAVREANCRADGIPEGYVDPLSARFVGEISGNAELREEKAQTFSVGALIQPRFIEGLSVSVDYWSIQINDAISSPSAQDIVDSCYDSAGFAAGVANQFCELFSRNRDGASPQFLGFNFLSQQELNFASLDARGIDAQISYDFEIGQNDLNITLNGTWNERLDNFFNPADPTVVDPELGELQRPEFAANGFLNFRRGPLAIQWQTQFQDDQALRGVEIETVDQIFGPAGIADAVFIHDLNANYTINDTVQIYGGINNITGRNPFVTEQAFPVSPLGRYFFAGARVTF